MVDWDYHRSLLLAYGIHISSVSWSLTPGYHLDRMTALLFFYISWWCEDELLTLRLRWSGRAFLHFEDLLRKLLKRLDATLCTLSCGRFCSNQWIADEQLYLLSASQKCQIHCLSQMYEARLSGLSCFWCSWSIVNNISAAFRCHPQQLKCQSNN